MLRVSKLADYATIIVNQMASDWKGRYSAVGLAEETDLPLPTVSKILKILASSGLLQSYRGAEGGYQLTRSPEKIPLSELIDAVEGPLAITECNIHEGVCDHETNCSLKSNWHYINQMIRQALSDITVADMANPLNKVVRIEDEVNEQPIAFAKRG